MPTVEERFWAKVDKSGPLWNGTPCWLWTASTRGGYGRFTANGKFGNAHRIIYEWTYGPIDPAWEVDHLCRNRPCVNVGHLEVVTRYENMMRGQCNAAINARKTHCIKGHEFNEQNTFTNSQGNRGCSTCRKWHKDNQTQRIREARNATK